MSEKIKLKTCFPTSDKRSYLNFSKSRTTNQDEINEEIVLFHKIPFSNQIKITRLKFLLVARCLLLFARCLLLFARYPLLFRSNYCEIKLLRSAKKCSATDIFLGNLWDFDEFFWMLVFKVFSTCKTVSKVDIKSLILSQLIPLWCLCYNSGQFFIYFMNLKS